MRVCQHCGVSIEGRASSAMYCDYVCKKRYYRKNRAVTEKKCFICGTKFQTSGHRGWKKSTCSDQCWKAWDRIKHARKNEFSTTIYGPLRPKLCLGCGERYISFGSRAKFCSEECKSIYYEKSGQRLSYARGRNSEQHMQDALTAIPAIMALINQTEKANDE